MRDEQLRDAAIANKWSTTLSTTILEYAAIALPSAQCWPSPRNGSIPRRLRDEQ